MAPALRVDGRRDELAAFPGHDGFDLLAGPRRRAPFRFAVADEAQEVLRNGFEPAGVVQGDPADEAVHEEGVRGGSVPPPRGDPFVEHEVLHHGLGHPDGVAGRIGIQPDERALVLAQELSLDALDPRLAGVDPVEPLGVLGLVAARALPLLERLLSVELHPVVEVGSDLGRAARVRHPHFAHREERRALRPRPLRRGGQSELAIARADEAQEHEGSDPADPAGLVFVLDNKPEEVQDLALLDGRAGGHARQAVHGHGTLPDGQAPVANALLERGDGRPSHGAEDRRQHLPDPGLVVAGGLPERVEEGRQGGFASDRPEDVDGVHGKPGPLPFLLPGFRGAAEFPERPHHSGPPGHDLLDRGTGEAVAFRAEQVKQTFVGAQRK